MRHFFLVGWIGLFFMAHSLSYGDSLDRADHSSWGPGGPLLAISPPPLFIIDEGLRKNKNFWIQIYSQYSSNQGLIHDAKYIDHVYEVLDLNDKGGKPSSLAKQAKKYWKNILFSVHRKQSQPDSFTLDERKVYDLFADIQEPDKFLKAAHRKRLRFQQGQKDHFAEGLYQSGRYLSVMEKLFISEGMPVELTRLPFVESSFNTRARSKVGATGVWQFMRSTAKLFIRVNEVVDERNDPIRATFAAARLLRLNYESLKNWPLAVTAYNHGRKGMMRAVRRVGSDELERVVTDYHQRSFGFASGNFYTEFLAALEVEKDAEKYFGKLERAPVVDFIEVQLPDFIEVGEFTRRMELDFKLFKELNPAFTEAVFKNQLLIPMSYPIRIPCKLDDNKEQFTKEFWKKYEGIPSIVKLKAQRNIKYGTKVKSVKRRNQT